MEVVWPAGKVRPSERILRWASESLNSHPEGLRYRSPFSHPGYAHSSVDRIKAAGP